MDGRGIILVVGFSLFQIHAEFLEGRFGAIHGYFYNASTEPLLDVNFHMECIALCQREVCCMSAVAVQNDAKVQCQMLKHIVSKQQLQPMDGASYFYIYDDADCEYCT
jgi:hypothetical protein